MVKLGNNSLARSEKGVGFLVQKGMTGIGDYEITWPTESDPRWKPTDWVKDEAEQNTIFEQQDWRMVVRTMNLPEPRSPYDTQPGGGGHVAPVGMGAVAHLIGNKDNEEWGYLGKHMANCCATSAKMMFDGHADATMHSFFSVLGAARADEEKFREYLDYAKTWIILCESHDGQGLIDQPFGCQRNSTCSISRNRTAYTHTAILLLSIPKRRLLITGADYAQPAPAAEERVVRPRQTSVAPPVRKVRRLSEQRLQVLNKALRRTLASLHARGDLKPLALTLSVSPKTIWLAEAGEDGQLVFKSKDGFGSFQTTWGELKDSDVVTLSLLVAELRPESKDAQAMAGVYLESVGRLAQAERYYGRAGEASVAKFAKLFD